MKGFFSKGFLKFFGGFLVLLESFFGCSWGFFPFFPVGLFFVRGHAVGFFGPTGPTLPVSPTSAFGWGGGAGRGVVDVVGFKKKNGL